MADIFAEYKYTNSVVILELHIMLKNSKVTSFGMSFNEPTYRRAVKSNLSMCCFIKKFLDMCN